jgi:hypothetical protein
LFSTPDNSTLIAIYDSSRFRMHLRELLKKYGVAKRL